MVVVTGKNTLAPEFIVSTDTGLDGVLQVSIIDSRAEEEIQQQQINDAADSRGGTAALLYTGKHILHCKHAIEGAGYGGHTPEDKKYWYIFAEGPEGKVSLEVEKVEAYRSNGELEFEGSLSYDFSIITLKEEAPTWIDRYEIYRETDEIGKNYLRVGYGMEGLGEYGRGDGFLPKEFWSSDTEGGQLVKRYGSNTYDMTEAEFLLKPTFTWDAESLGPLEARQAMLMSDFDDGTVENDAFGQGNIQEMKNVKHTGLGKWEVSSSPGNSGGPNFIDGRIAGVGSGGGGDHPSGQLIIDGSDDRPDGYGWYTNDSRVSSVIDWIEGIVGKNDNTSLITLPGTMVNDNLKTTGGPNKFYGYAGDDIIAGGDKEDIAGYRDVSSNYTITKDAKGLIKVKHTSFSVNTIDDGTDTLTGIEKLKFTDKVIDTSSINLTTSSLEITQDENYKPFNRYIDVGGLRIFGLDEVSDNFLNKVASTYEAMLASNNLINLEMRSAFIDTLKENYIFQRVGFDSPEYYGGGDKLPQHPINGNYKDNQTDYIWEGLSRSAASQTSTVIEHLLHTITGVGFVFQFSEWDPLDPSSKINLAMEQAIEGGYYDVSSYESIKLRGDDEGYAKAIVIEFSYWLILAEWEYFEITDKANNNIEFTLRTASDIASKLPLAHELYLDTAAKILSRPDETVIQSLFSKESEHNDSATNDESSASELDQQTYQEAGQSIEIIENSGTSYIDSLLNTEFGNPIKWVSDSFLNAEHSVNSSTVISYSFPGLLGTTALFNYTDDVGQIVAVPFSAQQAADTRLALAKISEYINVTFVEIEEVGDAVGTIRFGINTITDEEGNYREGIAATADPPSEEPRGGDVWFNKWFTNVADFSTGLVPYGKGDNIGSQTGVGDGAILIHEILHALGIEHPGDHPTILFPEDKNSREYTVMAGEFKNHPSVYIDGVDYIVSSTPMVYDIAAIQYLYGANMNHNSGDTTYSFDPDTPFIEAIWDAGGNDTLDFSNFSKTNTISLMDGEHSTIGFDVNWAMPEHLSIAFNAIIENVIGGSGDDTIKGNTSDNNIDGGSGIDTVIYNDEYSNYSITKNSAGFITVKHSDTGSITNEGEDILSNIEKIQFTDQTIETGSILSTSDIDPIIIAQNAEKTILKIHEHQYGQKLLDLTFLDIDEGTLEFKLVLQDGTLYGYGEKEVYQRFNIDKDSLSLQAESAFIGRDLSFIYDGDGDSFRTEAYITQISFTYKSNGVEKEHDVEFREIVDDIDRSGSFAGNKYTIDIYGPKINQLKEETIKSILDNTEYVIKDLSTKMSWKGTMDFGINVNTDKVKTDGVVSAISFQKGTNSLGEKIHSATHEQKTGEDLNGISVDLGFNISIQDGYDPDDGELEIYNMTVWFDPNPNPNSFSNKPANDGSSGQEPGYEDYVDFLSVVYHELFHSMGITYDGASNDANFTNEYSKNLLPADSDGNIYYSSERTESIIEGGILIRDYNNVGGGDHFDLGEPVDGIVKTIMGANGFYMASWRDPQDIDWAVIQDIGWNKKTEGILSKTIDSTKNVLSAHSETSLSGTLNFNTGENIIILDGQASEYRGLGGDDTYFVSQLVPKNSKITIKDTDGDNTVQIPANTYVDKSLFTKNAVRLTFEDSREVTINGADKFSYNIGGNVTNGSEGQDLTFQEFAFYFGINDVSGISGNEIGTVSDLYII